MSTEPTEPEPTVEPFVDHAASAAAEQAAEPPADATAPTETAASAEASDASDEQALDEQAATDASADVAAAAADGEEGVAPGKRRRKKKKKKKEAPVGPLARFFAHAAPRTHAFAVGEVVAGRVTRVGEGVVAVDLFGKAVAFADEREPEWAPPSDPPANAIDAAGASDGTSASDGASTGEEPAESGSSEAAAAPEDDAQAVDAAPAASSDETAATQDATTDAVVSEAPFEEAALDASDDDADAGDTLSGATVRLPPMPVVADEHARSEPATVATIYRGNVGAVSESGHIALLNRKVDVAKVRAELEQARESRRRVQGLVFGFNRGGFDVVVAGMRAFAPASAMALGEIPEPEALIGKRFEFLLPLGQPVDKGIIVTRRAILEREQRKRARELARALKPGQSVKGRVTQVLAFGVVVDLGGVDGLVHQSELSYAANVQPADVAKVGDEVEVQILKIEEAGKKSGRDRLPRLSLSLRALQPDPWEEHKAILAEGTIQKGKVAGLAEFGAFIELAPAVQGLLHVSELGKDLPHADRALKLDEEVHVVLERVDRKARRISLSRPSPSEVEDHEAGNLAASGPAPSLKQGARIKVKIERVEHAGIIVRVAGVVGKRARGFISTRDLGEGSGDLRKRFAQGSEIEVKVLGTDRGGGLRCSVKALQVDDERAAVRDYRKAAATEGFGTFADLLRQKLDTPAK